MRICAADGCAHAVTRARLCSVHGYRARIADPTRARCSQSDCGNPVQAKELCSTHYARRRQFDATRSRCPAPGCTAAEFARGLCYNHYQTARRHGVEPKQLLDMLLATDGACAICGQVPDRGLFVDHDHTTGEVRALICSPCNLVIGHAQENPDTLLAAATYLLQFSDVLQQAP